MKVTARFLDDDIPSIMAPEQTRFGQKGPIDMLVYLRTDLFASPAQTLVNTVNTVGVMGKGVAKTFKDRYPEMFRDYKRACDSGELRIGSLMLWRGPQKWVLNFPTKTTWRLPSELSYIEAGLRKFVEEYENLGITSVSFPPLGCGNGNLIWSNVKPMMETYLKRLPISVYIHDRQVGEDFVPEHLERQGAEKPRDFGQFIADIRCLVSDGGRSFTTISSGTRFSAALTESLDIRILREDKRDVIPADEVENVWSTLQTGLLTADQFSDESSRRYKSYLFAILAELPYVRIAQVQHVRGGNRASGHALFFEGSSSPAEANLRKMPLQGNLWV